MLKLLLSLMLATLLLGTASAQEMGTAMIAYDEGNAPRLVTANQSAGSVTLLERDSGKRLKEAQLGGDLRQLARADDGTLLVSDYRGDRLLLLDDDLDLTRRSPLAIDLRGHLRSQAAVVLGHAVRISSPAGL